MVKEDKAREEAIEWGRVLILGPGSLLLFSFSLPSQFLVHDCIEVLSRVLCKGKFLSQSYTEYQNFALLVAFSGNWLAIRFF